MQAQAVTYWLREKEKKRLRDCLPMLRRLPKLVEDDYALSTVPPPVSLDEVTGILAVRSLPAKKRLDDIYRSNQPIFNRALYFGTFCFRLLCER